MTYGKAQDERGMKTSSEAGDTTDVCSKHERVNGGRGYVNRCTDNQVSKLRREKRAQLSKRGAGKEDIEAGGETHVAKILKKGSRAHKGDI